MARSYAPCLCPTHTMLLTLSIDSCEPKVRPEGCRMWWGERRRRWRSTSAWAPAPSSAPEPHPPPCRRAGVEYAVLDELIFPERLPNDQHFRCALGVAPLRSAPLPPSRAPHTSIISPAYPHGRCLLCPTLQRRVGHAACGRPGGLGPERGRAAGRRGGGRRRRRERHSRRAPHRHRLRHRLRWVGWGGLV